MGEARTDDPSFLRQDISHFCVFNTDLGVTLATQVRVAGTSADRRRGLTGIDELAAGAGIWIAPCEAIHTFGMRMPIDVIFLDGQFRVRKVLQSLAPRRISVCLRACSVLELEAGAAAHSGTKPGHLLVFQPATEGYSSQTAQSISTSPTCRQS